MKKIKILLLSCTLVLLGLVACSDESSLSHIDDSEGGKAEAIELAKKWCKNFAKTKSSGNELIYAEPSWLYFAEQEKNSQIVLDIDVTDRIKQDFILENSAERFKETGNYDFRRSYTRLVYKRDVKTGEESGFFMTIAPSPYYTRTYRQRIEKRNTYLSRDKYLGGYVLYHNLDGEFVNGWKYKSGKVIAKIKKSQSGILKSNVTAENRIRIMKIPAAYKVEASLYVPNRTKSWESTDDGYYWTGDDIICTPDPDPWEGYEPWEPDGWDHGHYYDEHYEEEPGPGDGWYDDWGHNPNNNDDPESPTTPTDYVKKEGDKLANPNVADPGTTQLPNMCTMESFAYIHQLLGNSANLDVVTLRCIQMFGTGIMQDGLTVQEVQQYVNTYFNTGEFNSYQSSVNSGEFTLSTIKGDFGENSSHSVVIVGYHSNGDVIYMDPMDPKLQEADPSYFGDHYNISVNNSK